jgi:hypothetical protein
MFDIKSPDFDYGQRSFRFQKKASKRNHFVHFDRKIDID